MVSYLERIVDDTESLVTFIRFDAEHLPYLHLPATLGRLLEIETEYETHYTETNIGFTFLAQSGGVELLI